MKIKKVVSSLAAVTMALSSFAALSVTAGAEETGSSKTVDLQNAQTTFNRVVVKGDVPDDLSISVVNGDTEDTISADTGYQLFNKDHVYGVFNAKATNAKSTYGQYKSYTGDALKLTSSEDVSDLKVEVYNATDVARTGKEIADDNTLFTITPWGSGISDSFATDYIYKGDRFNNPVNNNPAHIYNMSSKFVKYKKKNQQNTDGLTENNGVDLVMKLNGEKNISQISYGNISAIGENKFAGDSYTVYYRTGDDGEWINAQDEYRADRLENHFICNLSTPVNASEIKLAIEFNPNSTNKYNDEIGSWTALYLSYLGIYDFGENLVAKDTSVGSNEVDLGKEYIFNRLTSKTVGTWQYKDANDKWVNIPEDGSDVTTRYIRVAGEDMVDKATPAFELSWEGNLVKYANEQKNGASLTVALPRNNADYSTWYDGKNNTAVSNQSTDKNAITLSFNGKANIKNVKETFGSGCWYPASIAIYASTNASDNVKIASVQNTLRVGDDGVHDTKRTEHNSYFENNFDINESVSNIVIKSLGSIRNECWAFIDNVPTTPTQDVNVAEIDIPGSVDLVSYNGEYVTVPAADGELTEVKEASAAYGNEVKVSADDSSDKQNAVGYVVTLKPNGNAINELGVQATGVGTDSVKKRLSKSETFGEIMGDSDFVFGFAASGVDSLSNIVVTADGEAVSTTAE